ncbi:MAG: GNAT family N-acetyltransferase [Lysobacterales bacterium]
MDNRELVIRNMRRGELDTLVDWAAAEGWNPGLSDAEIFWATDADGFIAAELDGAMVGGGSIVSYGGHFGFMGFFIVAPEYRGRGLGDILWHARLKRLIGRLQSPAVIGMDGVFDMQAWYAKGGFRFACRDLRFETVAQSFPAPRDIRELAEIDFAETDAYDRAHFPAPRSGFLRRWLAQPGAHALGHVRDDRLNGFGVVRPCRQGFKIGPLFADTPDIAEDLYRALSIRISGENIYIDVPEDNRAAMALAGRHGMKKVFGCAKMFFGPRPVLPESEIFGVTTFELG